MNASVGNSMPRVPPNASLPAGIDMTDPSSLLAVASIPNTKPREQKVAPAKLQTYVYQDFANSEPSALGGTSHERVPPQNLQSQKLPSKLAAMLQDPELTSVITWMPHGRSWKILNREMFSSFALPRYFGHSNHASFVRIVNAWGFRRITKGPDRDSYYHELFLRGKPRLHERMKRLPACHRKTPVEKEDRCPDFYGLAKTSPLPEVSFQGPTAAVTARTNAMAQMSAAGNSFLGNPMASQAAIGGFGMGNQFGFGAAGMGNDNMASFLQLLRQQQGLPPPQAGNGNDVMNQLLRMQQMQGAGASPSAVPSSAAQSIGLVNPGQVPMNTLPADQQRRPSDDKISMNDVLQLRSIERTNELLAQKLKMMQGDPAAMAQGAEPAAAPPTGGTPSKEEVLLQMIQQEKEGKAAGQGGNAGQGLDSLLKSLNGGAQQHPQM